MVTGLEILGAISASNGLAKDVVQIISRIHGFKDALSDIALRFADDANLINALRSAFQKDGVVLSDEDFDHLRRVFDHIEQLLKRVEWKLLKLERHKAQDHIDWAFFGKDLDADETNLYRWTERLGTRFMMLSPESKQLLVSTLAAEIPDRKNKLGDDIRQQQRMRHLAESPPTSLDLNGLNISNRVVVPSEPSKLMFGTRLDGNQWLVVDLLQQSRLRVPQGISLSESEWIKRLIGKLALVLKEVKPQAMHIPTVQGFFETGVPSNPFGLAYSLPPAYGEVRTLGQILQTNHAGKRPNPFHPLGERFRLAHDIVTAVAYIHSIGWVHKSIRSQNILVSWLAKHKSFPLGLGCGFVIGFEYARHELASSNGQGPGEWQNELYRHPERQNHYEDILPEQYYRRYHDVYSIGVVLLELGRWKSLQSNPHLFEHKSPHERKKVLLSLTENILPLVGQKYAQIVTKCLEADEHSPSTAEVLSDLEDLNV